MLNRTTMAIIMKELFNSIGSAFVTAGGGLNQRPIGSSFATDRVNFTNDSRLLKALKKRQKKQLFDEERKRPRC